jgi:phosphotransferase system  glucose/maltose/N-acetylglucosamine-specific IIC component
MHTAFKGKFHLLFDAFKVFICHIHFDGYTCVIMNVLKVISGFTFVW